MGNIERPLPQLDNPDSSPFWSAARQRRLEFQRCSVCGYVRWPPATLCPECLTPGGVWIQVEPYGHVWSFAIYRHGFHPWFAQELPYIVALVELDAGPRVITNLVHVGTEKVACEMRVEATFEDVNDEVTLVKFRPQREEATDD